jgi:hydroxymethylpyrimidine/phosphomethylpyrimidine kinase
MGRAIKPGPPVVCSIGSTDPTAAAGLFADAAHYARLRVRAVFVVAGVTAQNSARVTTVCPMPAAVIRAQLDAVWAQVHPDAIRVGLLPGAASVGAVRRFLAGLRRRPPIVVDPVLAASSGRAFQDQRAIAALRGLIRYATIATPNRHEASLLAAMPVGDVEAAERAAQRLARHAGAVLVTGGDAQSTRSVDVLVHDGRTVRLAAERIRVEMRGTGCALSAALAAHLASGIDLERAVRRARAYVRRAIATARPLGRGKAQHV